MNKLNGFKLTPTNSIYGANHTLCCPRLSRISMQENYKRKQEQSHSGGAITISIGDQGKKEREEWRGKVTSRISK